MKTMEMQDNEFIRKFNELRYHSESEVVEFKKAENNFDIDDLGKYFSALSNEANLRDKDFAWLIFGVHDKTREVLGTSFKDGEVALNKLKNDMSQHTTENIIFRDIAPIYVDGKRVLMFKIPASPHNMVMKWKGVAYGRVGESLRPLDQAKQDQIRNERPESDFTAQIIEDASIADLDDEAIAIALKGYCERFPDKAEIAKNWDTATFLDKAKITINGKVTFTALLLLGKEESAHYLGHIAQMVWRLQTGEERAAMIFYPPFLTSTSKLLACIRNYRFKLYPNNSLIPTEVWKYDTRTILEALHNCIAHQNYRLNERIVVTELQEDLVFKNAGNFYDGDYEDYIEGLKTPTKYRNPFLVSAMVNIKMIDSQGFGIHDMYERQKNRYLPMPDYDFTEVNHVSLTIPGRVINMDYSLMLLDNSDLDLVTIMLLDSVQKNKPISKEAISHLRKMKLIEGRSPNLFISKQIAKTTHAEIEYTDLKGFDDEYYCDYILKALTQHGKLKRADFNKGLIPKLPAVLSEEQKVNKIGNLLTALRKKGKIKLGENKYWELVK
jgi:ATP-dependent DNA helicase RecG